MSRFVRTIACLPLLAAGVGGIGADEDMCGYPDASSRCPGCFPHCAPYGCSCKTETGDCVDYLGNPALSSVSCSYSNWSWTADEDGQLIGAREAVCKTITICEPALPMFDCSGVNPCESHVYRTYRTEYYIESETCPEPQ